MYCKLPEKYPTRGYYEGPAVSPPISLISVLEIPILPLLVPTLTMATCRVCRLDFVILNMNSKDRIEMGDGKWNGIILNMRSW